MFSSSVQFDRRKATLMDEVLALVRERMEPCLPVEAFVRQYYAGVAPEDLAERETADLYGAALAHWDLAKKRPGADRKLRVYNPSFQEYGWQSTHTAVEIVGPDMPFLVDSVSMALNRHGFTIHLIIHPIMRLIRDAQGALRQVIHDNDPEGGIDESIMHAEIDRETDPQRLAALRDDLNRVLDDVRTAVEDWPRMRDTMAKAIVELDDYPHQASDIAEVRAFLEWLSRDNYTFLGYRDHDLVEQDREEVLRIVPASGLGILREQEAAPASRSFAVLPASTKRLAHDPYPLIVTKSSSRSTVHRPGYLDYVGIKRADRAGKVIGERRFLGLYTSGAYYSHARAIPWLRRKVERVIARSGVSPQSHSGKSLQHILDTYPRDELFQATEEELFQTAMGILHLQERQRVRLFVRQDPYERFVSCLVFVPRDRYHTELRQRIQAIFRAAFHAEEVDFTVALSESALARIHFIVRTRPGALPEYDVAAIEARLIAAARSWADRLHEALIEAHGEETGNDLFRRYQDAFPASYREDCGAGNAVQDIERIEAAINEKRLEMSWYRPPEAVDDLLKFKLYHPAGAIPLSTVLPMLEHMGVAVIDDRPYEIEPAGTTPVWIHDFGLRYAQQAELDADTVGALFQEAFARLWDGTVESDTFSCLVLRAKLNAREIMVLQAYSRYLRQLGVAFSLAYMAECLLSNPNCVRLLIDLFHARFDPRRDGRFAAATVSTISARLEAALEGVASLDEDRILNAFLSLIQATLRTNYFQRDASGAPKPYIAVKLDPSLIPEMPRPRPTFEIFVYSARVEGVHLRGGKVARGGIRWSDRREDFRTEVLGLMKAQMVKNAVIVPVGAKGGFVVKRLGVEGDRDAQRREGIACYQTFIRGLLDLTDNRVGHSVSPPPNVVRYDGDDPYLVVAADKGTATFSDIANGIALEYGFWLGDAFASGGSAGYDHKQIGITARGAWESVKHHFDDLGLDVDKDDFTVVGIGDMAGDVFGNGMLLSRHIKLVGAFNHQHIFLDPDPDPQASYAERKRLFALPGSSWADYNRDLISKGGGVHSRAAKSIPLSAELRRVLDIESNAVIPADLIRALLRAPVDLLWNGGIGTFVKASAESHAEAGDRANDGLRVNGRELRCRVLAEGGNLGITQRGRVEYALAGGKLNTDAIDNSGGVDCSDHEVNIKIALDAALAKGDLTSNERNALLVQMTDEVASLVLQDNYRQPRAITVGELESERHLEWYRRFMTALDRKGAWDRHLEALPSDEDLAQRQAAQKGLTRPELAVLLAYAKTSVYPEILASTLADDPYLVSVLERYFPAPLRRRTEIREHRLRREILATMLTNSIVNRAGISFAQRLHDVTGSGAPAIARAYMIARETFDVRSLWNAIDGLDRRVPRKVQVGMVLKTQATLEQATRWFMRRDQQYHDIAATVARFSTTVAELAGQLAHPMAAGEKRMLDELSLDLKNQAVPDDIAKRVASLIALVCALDLSELAARYGLELEPVANVYFRLGERLKLNWLRDQVSALPSDNRWQERAQMELNDDLLQQQAAITAVVLYDCPKPINPQLLLDLWQEQHREPMERYHGTLAELKGNASADLAMLTVALSNVRELARCGAT